MRKTTLAVMIGFAGMTAAPTPALAGECEIRHTMAIAACDGNQACGDSADMEYLDCLRRQVTVNE